MVLMWSRCCSTPINDIRLIQRLHDYDVVALQSTELKMMQRHSWYLIQEPSTCSLCSLSICLPKRKQFISTMIDARRLHLVQSLPRRLAELSISWSLFRTSAIDDNFLEEWPESHSYKIAYEFVNNLTCVNNSAEQGVALIQNLNSTIMKNEVSSTSCRKTFAWLF